jgi:ABC-type transport system involved in multi-copper enzyme maturation permease subunit
VISDANEMTEIADTDGAPGWSGRLRRLVANPLIVKDGLSRVRSWRAPAAIGLYLGLLGVFAWLVISLQTTGFQRTAGYAQVGSTVFTALAVVQLALVCLFTPGVAAGAISGERERQTLDVLLVSCVSSFSIVWGKLIASVAFIVVLIVAALPLFATVFLFGGIDGQQFLVAQLLTVTTALATGAVSVFLSALFRRSLAATVAAYGVTFAATAGTWAVGTILTQIELVQSVSRNLGPGGQAGPPDTSPLLYVNPIHAMTTVLEGSGAVTLGRFTQVLFLTVGPPRTGGPTIEPWQTTVAAQLALVVLAVLATIRLLRRGRVFAGPVRSDETIDSELG